MGWKVPRESAARRKLGSHRSIEGMATGAYGSAPARGRQKIIRVQNVTTMYGRCSN